MRRCFERFARTIFAPGVVAQAYHAIALALVVAHNAVYRIVSGHLAPLPLNLRVQSFELPNVGARVFNYILEILRDLLFEFGSSVNLEGVRVDIGLFILDGQP
jgi:hypothetical protein